MRKIILFLALSSFFTSGYAAITITDEPDLTISPTVFLLGEPSDIIYTFDCNYDEDCLEYVSQIYTGLANSRRGEDIIAINTLFAVKDATRNSLDYEGIYKLANTEIIRVYLKEIKLAERDKNWQEVSDLADQIIIMDKDNIDGHYNKARAYYYLGEYENSIKEYDKAVYNGYLSKYFSDIEQAIEYEKAQVEEALKAEKANLPEETIDTSVTEETIATGIKTPEENTNETINNNTDDEKIATIKKNTEVAFGLIKSIIDKENGKEAIYTGLYIRLGELAPKYDEDKQIMIEHLRELIQQELN